MNSASAWLRAQADAHELALGELRLDLAGAFVALGDRRLERVSAVHERQLAGRRRSARRRRIRAPQPGQTSSSRRSAWPQFTPRPVRPRDTCPSFDPPRPDLCLVAVQADDDPQHARPQLGEVDVGLGGIRRRARVRVVDRSEIKPGVVDLVVELELLLGVDPESQRAGLGVRRSIDLDRVAVARARPSRSTRSAPPRGRGRSSRRTEVSRSSWSVRGYQRALR